MVLILKINTRIAPELAKGLATTNEATPVDVNVLERRMPATSWLYGLTIPVVKLLIRILFMHSGMH
jgi:hypothetical protein